MHRTWLEGQRYSSRTDPWLLGQLVCRKTANNALAGSAHLFSLQAIRGALGFGGGQPDRHYLYLPNTARGQS
jgi:hypothetical protein